MSISTHMMKGNARFYPCIFCDEDHPSTTTVLDVIGSGALMGWAQKMGTKKLLMYETRTKEVLGPKDCEKMRKQLQLEWEALGETSDFWKNGTESAKEAADFGTTAHAAFEMFLQGKHVDLASLPIQSANAFYVFRKFADENKLETLSTEKTFYNCKFGTAGTADWVGRINGKLTLADWKTSTGIFEKNVVQCWANAIADEMQNGNNLYEQIMLGRFGKDGSTDILIVPRNGLENGLGSYEQARVLIQSCVAWFHYKEEWQKKFPYIKPNKNGAKK